MSRTSITLLFIFYCLQITTAQSRNEVTLITNITIISANEHSVVRTLGHVLIEGDRIVFVGSEKPVLSDAYEEVDGSGKFLIPGLIDSHVHLANTAGFNGPLKKKHPELIGLYYKQLPKNYLYFGFTTLIDVNNYWPERINKILQTEIRPDIYTCGEQVEVLDGFNMEMEEYSQQQRYQSNFLNDTYYPNNKLPDTIPENKHTPQHLVKGIREQQGICAKLVYEDEASGLAVRWKKPSVPILKELVLEAKKYNMPLLLHAPSLEGHKIGLQAGVQIFAHALWNWSDDPKQFNNDALGDEHKKVLREIAQKQIAYQLTFRTISGEKDLITPTFLKDRNLLHVFPKPILEMFRSDDGKWGRNKIFGRTAFLEKTSPEFYKALRGDFKDDQKMWNHAFKVYEHRLNTVANFLADNNANLILGTDSPAMNMYTNPPGYNGILEIEHWSKAGISLEKIFRAATYNNAKAFNIEHLYGSIEKDKIANILILRTDPLETISAYNDIERVIVRGNIIDREKLSALSE